MTINKKIQDKETKVSSASSKAESLEKEINKNNIILYDVIFKLKGIRLFGLIITTENEIRKIVIQSREAIIEREKKND